MRIAILTFHRAYNCGAMLQAWALKTVLEQMGHIVEFPICNHVGERSRWPKPWFGPFRPGLRCGLDVLRRLRSRLYSIPNEDILIKRYKDFRRAHLPERHCLPADFGRHYDLIVVGSDQVWSEKHTLSEAPLFFGECLPNDIRRIVYAASYGDKPLEADKIGRIARALENFSAVSVREKMAKDQLSILSNKRIDETIDPTLLVEAFDYAKIAAGKVPVEPYLFMYTLSTADFFVNTAKDLACRLGVKCVIAPCYQYSRYGAPSGLTYGISPDRLVQYARNAKYVLAGSFHGTVMGVQFSKPFLSLRAQVDEFESRPAALLRKLGCEDRIVNPLMSTDEMCRRLCSPLPDLRGKIAVIREESMKWLRDALVG